MPRWLPVLIGYVRPVLEESQVLAFLTALALLLLVGRLAGELARRAGQPEVLGQIAAGVLLGPSVLGGVAPHVQRSLFTDGGTGAALAGLSNIGAVVLLLVAGLEVDLRVLRRELRPGLWVAATAIVPSVVAGVVAGQALGARDLRAALYLGIVLSVTAISVVTTLFVEAGETRRRYGQVVLAGGVAAEVSVWVLVSSTASEGSSPLVQTARSVAFAAAVFAVAFFVGRRVVPAVMRLAADTSRLPEAPFTAVLALALLAGAATAALHLHPLLGAFLVGVLLARSPRTNAALLQRIESLTVAVFAPVFFVLAGTRVDLGTLLRPSAVVAVGGLLLLATVVKVGAVALGARLGGLRGAEPVVVAVAMNLKGGTDVLVAILGQQLHILSAELYTEYAVVALLTVLVTPPVLRALQRRVVVTADERQRLEQEEARSRSYLPRVERVVVPFAPELHPSLAADVVDRLARRADAAGHLLDVTQLHLDEPADAQEASVGHGVATLAGTSEVRSVRMRQTRSRETGDVVEQVVQAVAGHDVLAIGASLDGPVPGTLAPMQNTLIDLSPTDVLVVAGAAHALPWERIRRVLVPVNGSAHAAAAAEVAGHLAASCGAEVVLLAVLDPEVQHAVQRRESGLSEQLPGAAHLDRIRFLLSPTGVRVRELLLTGEPEDELRRLLRRGGHDLVVMGAVDHAGDGIAWLGPTVETVVTQRRTPYVLLITHTRD